MSGFPATTKLIEYYFFVVNTATSSDVILTGLATRGKINKSVRRESIAYQ